MTNVAPFSEAQFVALGVSFLVQQQFNRHIQRVLKIEERAKQRAKQNPAVGGPIEIMRLRRGAGLELIAANQLLKAAGVKGMFHRQRLVRQALKEARINGTA